MSRNLAEIPTRNSAAARPMGGAVSLLDPAEDGQPSLPEVDPLVERAYAEWWQIPEGQRPDFQSYCARYPAITAGLLHIFFFHLFLGEKSETFLEPAPEEDSTIWPKIGERRGDWTVVRLLGRGTFARVFLAHEASTGDRSVAVKFSKGVGAEAHTLGRLTHPNVVPILSARYEKETDLTAVCMPYLGSATLEAVLRLAGPASWRPRNARVILDVLRSCAQPEDPPAGPISPCLLKGSYTDAILHLAARLAETLAFLHSSGVCHRDLKPSNVLLDPSGNPLLLDFNLSAGTEESGPVGGTLHYTAPEVIQNFLKIAKPVMDGRADLFSLAVIVHELLTGEHPCGPFPLDLQGPRLGRHLLERLNEGVSPFGRIPGLARPVATALDRCLAVNPADRLQDAATLAAALKRQFTPARRLRRWVAERPRRVLASLGLLVFAAALPGYAWSVKPPYSEREYRRGADAYRRGDYDMAEIHFNLAVQADPNNPRLRHARGVARLKQSRYHPDDLANLDRAWEDLSAAPDGRLNAALLAARAYITARQQQPGRAIPMYNQLEQNGYRRVMVLNNRAYCYLQTGQFEEAQRDLDEVARHDPDCQAVLYNKATLALRRRVKDPKISISPRTLENIERVIQLGPRTATLYRDAASLYALAAEEDHGPDTTDRRSQRIERALDHLREAIDAGEPTSITNLRVFRRNLSSQSAFADLNKRPHHHVLPPIELHLLDPIELPE